MIHLAFWFEKLLESCNWQIFLCKATYSEFAVNACTYIYIVHASPENQPMTLALQALALPAI